jgi:hypothetical protein
MQQQNLTICVNSENGATIVNDDIGSAEFHVILD